MSDDSKAEAARARDDAVKWERAAANYACNQQPWATSGVAECRRIARALRCYAAVLDPGDDVGEVALAARCRLSAAKLDRWASGLDRDLAENAVATLGNASDALEASATALDQFAALRTIAAAAPATPESCD